eukprot:706160-Pelagomonas_calceolata.AAC.1
MRAHSKTGVLGTAASTGQIYVAEGGHTRITEPFSEAPRNSLGCKRFWHGLSNLAICFWHDHSKGHTRITELYSTLKFLPTIQDANDIAAAVRKHTFKRKHTTRFPPWRELPSLLRGRSMHVCEMHCTAK